MKTLHKIAVLTTILFVANISIYAQSVLITPQKSKISDTLEVKKQLVVGLDTSQADDIFFKVRPNLHTSFFVPNWDLAGSTIVSGNFYSPNGKFTQLRFESEGNSFFDIGRNEVGQFIIEHEDDPKLWISDDNKVTIKNRIAFDGSGRSVFIGEDAGKNDDLSDNNNVYIGHWAGNDNVEGNNNVAIGTEAFTGGLGSYNFALGTHALQNNVNGNDNIAIGNFAGYASDGNNNILIGSGAGESLIGTRNIIIGRELGTTKTMDNALWIDVENTNNPLIQGDFADNSLKINGKFSTTNAVGLKTDAPKSTLDVNGSMGVKVKSGLESGVDDVDDMAGIWIYTIANGVVVLPPASTCPNRIYTIVNKTASTLTISEFKDLMNAIQTTILSAKSIEIVSDGSEWQQIR
jgi:hypothetical protein